VIKATGSNAVRADSLHYRSDLLLNGSILLALVLASVRLPAGGCLVWPGDCGVHPVERDPDRP
jgi:divalent metal cation (Fe/Co/Zn/Cd) transporter